MEDQAFWGMVFGAAGALIGLAGGAVGTYFSIKNTSGPLERAFMVKLSLFFWIYLVAVFGGLYFIAPALRQYSVLFLLPVFLLIPYLNKKQRAIALLEQSEKQEPQSDSLQKRDT